MVVIIIKGNNPSIREERVFSSAPDLAELEDWVEQAMEGAGGVAQEFELLMDGKALSAKDTVQTIRQCGRDRAVLTIKLSSEQPAAVPAPAAVPVAGPARPACVPEAAPVAVLAAVPAAGPASKVIQLDLSRAEARSGLLQPALVMRERLERAARSLRQGEGNSLLLAARESLARWAEVRAAAEELAKRGYGDVAEGLMKKVRRTYDQGLEKLTVFHGTGRRAASTLRDLSEACELRSTERAQGLARTVARFSRKLSGKSQEVERDFEALVAFLGRERAELERLYQEKCSLTQGCRWIAGVAFVAAPFSAALPGGPVPPILAAGTSLAASAGAGLSSWWNSQAADSYDSAKGAAATIVAVTENVHGANRQHTAMWEALAESAAAMDRSLRDLQGMSRQEHLELVGDLGRAVSCLEELMGSQDEYIVYMAESQLYPISFNARLLVGPESYDRIALAMDIGRQARQQRGSPGQRLPLA